MLSFLAGSPRNVVIHPEEVPQSSSQALDLELLPETETLIWLLLWLGGGGWSGRLGAGMLHAKVKLCLISSY